MDWIPPLRGESLAAYANRIREQWDLPEACNLLGVSFGGMIATEIAKLHPPANLFLISSIGSRKELPLIYRIAGFFRLHRLIPVSLLTSPNFFSYFLFGVKDRKSKDLLAEILRDTDPRFLRWALGAILTWKNKQKPSAIRIHGSRDYLLKAREADHLIPGAGHFMVVTHAAEVAQCIEQHL